MAHCSCGSTNERVITRGYNLQSKQMSSLVIRIPNINEHCLLKYKQFKRTDILIPSILYYSISTNLLRR